jgi:hypothetical protein
MRGGGRARRSERMRDLEAVAEEEVGSLDVAVQNALLVEEGEHLTQ